jgi:hypothetical protein
VDKFPLIAHARDPQGSHPGDGRHLSLHSPPNVCQSMAVGLRANNVAAELAGRTAEFALFYPFLFTACQSGRKNDAHCLWRRIPRLYKKTGSVIPN